jgi:hypothetical protein
VFATIQSVIRRLNQDTTLKNPPKPITNNFHDQLLELLKILKPMQVFTDRIQSDALTSNIAILSVVTAYKGTFLQL